MAGTVDDPLVPGSAARSGEALRGGTVRLSRPDDVDGWREAARACLAAGVPPAAIVWDDGSGSGDLFGDGASIDPPDAAPGDGASAREASGGELVARAPVRVPRAFMELAERVVCHTDPGRFALLYRVLWRRAHGEPALLANPADPDMLRLHALGKRVSRERHKMHAFVRFRKTPGVEPEHYGAWFEPEHHTLRLSSGFFVRRFANMRWSIVTPAESAHWDGETLTFGPGGQRGAGAGDEAMEALWRTYFANIFNPARLKLDAMRSEMPVKYWRNLPEAPLIAELVHAAGGRSEAMIAAAPTVPPRFAARATSAPAGAGTSPKASAAAGEEPFADLAALRAGSRHCTRCDHACRATRTVDGEGAPGAALMLVGEQAGDREDLRGRPFVGPAGTLLRELLAELGAAPESLYLTNAVRHFRFEVRGKRRLHRSPTIEHVDRCRPWLFEEIRLVRPRVIVALGATAGRALLGRAVAVERERGGRFRFGEDVELRLSVHPASVLRERDAAARAGRRDALSADLAAALRAAGVAASGRTPPLSMASGSTAAGL